MADAQDIELKPCPCCGAKAELTSGEYNDLLLAKVECMNCRMNAYADSDRYDAGRAQLPYEEGAIK